jgi:4-amino-4-deoxy-L-arabinose transferase-like glycosyltransferase
MTTSHLFEVIPSRRWQIWLSVLLLLVLGLGIRLYDLTDPTFQTRQLHGAVLARGMYYKMLPNADPRIREQAISFWKATTQYEPPILERLSAITDWVIGRELGWMGRLYSSLFWVAGGIGLFALARRYFARESADWGFYAAAFGGLAYYLLLPFAVDSSRDFQSDPGMVMWAIFSIYTLDLWDETRSWKSAVLAGLISGMAILVKVTAIFMIAPPFIVLALRDYGIKRALTSIRLWLMALLMVLPSIVYILIDSQGGQAATYFQNTTLNLLHLITQPTFYLGWFSLLERLTSFPMLMLGFLGILIIPPRARGIIVSIWVGYVLYGITFPHQIGTHDYYHLRMVPIIALSLIPILQAVIKRVEKGGWIIPVGLAGFAILVLGFPLWLSYSQFSKTDSRQQAARWQEIGTQLPEDGKILAITQEYGFPLMYYGWRKVNLWPTIDEQQLKALRGNPKRFERLFEENTAGMDYFLVTDLEQFDEQSELKQRLFHDYSLVVEESDFLLFDLNHPQVGN